MRDAWQEPELAQVVILFVAQLFVRCHGRAHHADDESDFVRLSGDDRSDPAALAHAHDADVRNRDVLLDAEIVDGRERIGREVLEAGRAPVAARALRATLVGQQHHDAVILQELRQRQGPAVVAAARTGPVDDDSRRKRPFALRHEQHAREVQVLCAVPEPDFPVARVCQRYARKRSRLRWQQLLQEDRAEHDEQCNGKDVCPADSHRPSLELLLQPRVHALLEQVQWQCPGAQQMVVEGADVELVAEGRFCVAPAATGS